MPKRRRGRQRGGPNSTFNAPFATRYLLPLLQPVRHSLHPLLTAAESMRLLQTSRSTAVSLLAGYSLDVQLFRFHTAAELKRTVAFYDRYDVKMRRVCLPAKWHEPLVDSSTGQPLLPGSLTALTVGQDVSTRRGRVHSAIGDYARYAALDGIDGILGGEQEPIDVGRRMGDQGEFYRLIRPFGCTRDDGWWDVAQYERSRGGLFVHPIPAGALPFGLRFLQLCDAFNQPLHRGSLPDTVEVLQFGELFDQPLAAGHLPASLVHLVFGAKYNQVLLPGVLPAGLRRLFLGEWHNQRLLTGALPPQLGQLAFGILGCQPIDPGVIPPSVTHLLLGQYFNHPLQRGSIPEGVVHLCFSEKFNHPLPAGVLPSTLRQLGLSWRFTHPLQPGSLPDGLEVLSFCNLSEWPHIIQPGIIPASVVAISLGWTQRQSLVPGGIPATVRWLRMYPTIESGQNAKAVLSPSTRVVWWRGM